MLFDFFPFVSYIACYALLKNEKHFKKNAKNNKDIN